MLLKSLLAVMGLCVPFFLSYSQSVQAGELIIHNEGALTIKSGASLLMNCNDLTIENGGEFTLNGGTVQERGKLIVESGGQYTIVAGAIDKCNNSFYVIPAPDGKRAVICL